MDRAELAAELASGRSIESIARDHGRDPSTVAYWVNKHGLASTYASRHVARGAIPRERLAELVEAGLTVQRIAEEVGRGATTVRYWLKKHGLTTVRSVAVGPERPPLIIRRCRTHGYTEHLLTSGGKRYAAAAAASMRSRRGGAASSAR